MKRTVYVSDSVAGRLKHLVSTGPRIILTILFAAGLALASCSSDPDDTPPPGPGPGPGPGPDPVPDIEYLAVNSEGHLNQLSISSKSSDNTEFTVVTTTEGDPYLFTKGLKNNKSAEDVVLEFEYKSTHSLAGELQIFFAEPLSEDRSTKCDLPKADDWTTYAVNLKSILASTGWGRTNDYLRLDYGKLSAAVTISMRKIHFREMNDEEREAEEELEAKAEWERNFDQGLQDYLSATFTSDITNVDAGSATVTVTGTYTGDGEYKLCEVPPYVNVTDAKTFEYTTTLDGSPFTEVLDRYVEHDGINYDRTLSKWVVTRTDGETDEIVSHARYADNIYIATSPPKQTPASQKGLGGMFGHSIQISDLDDLGITSGTINIPLGEFMSLSPGEGKIAHSYGGKTYYFKPQFDAVLQEAANRNIVMSAIILVQPGNWGDGAGMLLQHPEYVSGYYSMPNMTDPESVNAYAAVLDFLASRYCQPGSPYGRIHHWIMHNEVDMGTEWTNMGHKPMYYYLNAYVKSMRICYNIARQYDSNTEVFASFTHSWAQAENAATGYAVLDMIDGLNQYSAAEGDFMWGLAYHCYPQDLTNPRTWQDNQATFSMSTPKVTYKNLEVLDKWAKTTANKYMGTTKRSIWLSENGINAPSYSDSDLALQAAGFAYGWKKIAALDGIDGHQWHNWYDNPKEFGLRIGLRMFPDNNMDPKPVWEVYQAAGTAQEDEVFAKYLPVIGISDWNIIMPVMD